MSATTYNAGVATRQHINAGAVKTGKAVKTGALCVADFFKGLFGAELKPARKPRAAAAKKPAAKRVVRKASR